MKVAQEGHLDRFYRNDRLFSLADRLKAKPWHCVLFALFMVLGDFLSGSRIQFPFLYIIPVSIAAWGGNKALAYWFALLLPATRIPMTWLWNLPLSPFDIGINLMIRVAVLAGIVYLLLTLQTVRLLRGILHTCSYCHRIKTAEGEWKLIEQYMTDYSEAMFSHGICPDCSRKYWGIPSQSIIKGPS